MTFTSFFAYHRVHTSCSVLNIWCFRVLLLLCYVYLFCLSSFHHNGNHFLSKHSFHVCVWWSDVLARVAHSLSPLAVWCRRYSATVCGRWPASSPSVSLSPSQGSLLSFRSLDARVLLFAVSEVSL